MGRKKLLKKLAEFFDMDARDRDQRRDEINELLSRLKSKELELRQKLEAEPDENRRQEIAQKIDLVHGQRKKGIGMMIDIKNEDRE